jgi:translocation and assembly module TamB
MRFNSILGAIVFIFMTSLLAFVIFVQTKTFAGLVTKIVTDISWKRTQTRVSIDKVDISLFPPGLELIKVTIDKQVSNEDQLQAEFGTIGVYLNLIQIEERKLSFAEIRLSDSVIDFKFKKTDEPPPDSIEQELVDQAFEAVDNLPFNIDTILIENAKLHVNYDLMDIKRVKLFKAGKSVTARFHIANLRPDPSSDQFLDEIWAEAEIGRKHAHIHRLKIQHDVHSLIVKGKILDYRLLKKADVTLNGESNLFLNAFNKSDFLPEMVTISNGRGQVSFNLALANEKITGDASVVVQDLKSSIVHADFIASKLSFDQEQVIISDFELRHKKQTLKISQPTMLVDLKRKKILPVPVKADVKSFSLNNALRILGPSMKVLRGGLSGQLIFQYKDGDLHFKPTNGFIVKNLRLMVGDKSPFQILKVTTTKLNNAEFALIGGEFQMSASVEADRSKIDIDGFVNKKEARFSSSNSKINLEDLGNLAKLDLTGEGLLSIDVVGPLDDTELIFRGKMANFGVLGYKLGQSDIDLSIGLKDGNVTIKKLDSLYRKTALSGNGVINYNSLDIAIGINTTSTNYNDLSTILKPIIGKLNFLPDDLEVNASIDALIYGKVDLPQLKIKAGVKYNDLTAYGETLNQGAFSVELMDQVFSIKNFEGTKDRGLILGHFSFSLPNDYLKVNFGWDNLSLMSFAAPKRMGLNLESKVTGKIVGEGRLSDYLLNLDTKFYNTKSSSYIFEDSYIQLKLLPGRVAGSLDLLGKTLQSDFDYSLSKARKSNVSLRLNAPEIKSIAVAFLGSHLEGESFSGAFLGDLETSFYHGLSAVDFVGHLKNLELNYDTFQVKHASEVPQFKIQKDKIENWDLRISQPDLYVMTKGKGTFGKGISLFHEFHFNSKLLEVFLARVLSSEGFIRNIIKLDSAGSDYQVTAFSKTTGLNLSIDGAPFPLNQLKYTVEYAGRRLFIKELMTSLDSGSASLVGDIFFEGDAPDINIKYQFDRAEIPILSKSLINVTGEGIILGNDYPYNLGGELTLNKVFIVNELSDFTSRSSGLNQIRFLPKTQDSAAGKLLNLNVNLKIDNPARVTNSLMDVALKGDVRLTGNPLRPRAEGRLFAPPNSSRIFFKNNEYFLTTADLNFSAKKEITNPDFDIQALTIISSYKVYPKAYGDLERFNFDLTSEPALPRNSILSLIAFGYTDEIQSTLTQGEQQNLTQVGVGSFVFDRFKISDILNKQFGLQVNLGTVFEQSQTESMLSGRSQDGQGTLGRTRSATKIELKKRLDEAMTLSVSSTMGGSIGQRQSMNLTYSLNKKVQLEGVYELRTNEEGVEDVIDNSIGGDLKFRWSKK